MVLAIHQRQISEHGGLDGVRDINLLRSALERPQNLLFYAESPPDIATLAASYAYGIARNHPFADGNKRVALVVCRTFLKLNGEDIFASQEEKFRTILALAAGELAEHELASWIRERLVKSAN